MATSTDFRNGFGSYHVKFSTGGKLQVLGIKISDIRTKHLQSLSFGYGTADTGDETKTFATGRCLVVVGESLDLGVRLDARADLNGQFNVILYDRMINSFNGVHMYFGQEGIICPRNLSMLILLLYPIYLTGATPDTIGYVDAQGYIEGLQDPYGRLH